MSKTKKTKYDIMDNPIAVLIIAVLSIILGIFFIVTQNDNNPIPRKDALSYSGYFDYYDTSWENYREIHFTDGSVYDVYPHTESTEFREKMESLAKNTKLYILVNPNNEYVVEVNTNTEELLNFETSQRDIDSYDNVYIAIGIFAICSGIFLILYEIGTTVYKRKEKARHNKAGQNINILRYADHEVKSRTLLEANVQSYRICYRRVRFVNELVINGRVYDEKKGVLEFEHKLCAIIDGHSIEAGLDNENYSYIMFDGERMKQKKRLM